MSIEHCENKMRLVIKMNIEIYRASKLWNIASSLDDDNNSQWQRSQYIVQII